MPLSAVVAAGQAHEARSLVPTIEAVRIKRPGRGRPRRLAGDKGYSYRRIRRQLRRRGIKAVIPTRRDPRSNTRLDAEAYRRRSIVERCILWLKSTSRVDAAHRTLSRVTRSVGGAHPNEESLPRAIRYHISHRRPSRLTRAEDEVVSTHAAGSKETAYDTSYFTPDRRA